MLMAENWDAFALNRLRPIREVLLAHDPDPDRLAECEPGINLRLHDGERVGAFMLTPEDTEESMGVFVRRVSLAR